MAELVAVEEKIREVSQSILEMTPVNMVTKATEMATVLKDIVTKQKLATNIAGREYVRYEGWATLGSMLGFLPREKYVKELEDGSYEAMVELYNIKTGAIVGQASAICAMDEKRWRSAEKYARRSMAITRATGKAYRLGFAWIMALAGYAGTPQEEMPAVEKVFDKTKPIQVERLKGYLGNKPGMPKDTYPEVIEQMHGKEFRQQEIEDVISEIELTKVFAK